MHTEQVTVTQARTDDQVQHWTWTVPQVLRMVEVGLLDEDDRTELIEGELVVKVTSGGRHVTTINRLNMRLAQAAGDQYVVSVQNPLLLGPRSLPEPDLAIHREREDAWRLDRLPEISEIVLLIEVADSTVAADRRRKIPLYASYGCPELWLVDLVHGVLERYTQPAADGFGSLEKLVGGEIAPLLAPELRLSVLDVLRSSEG